MAGLLTSIYYLVHNLPPSYKIAWFTKDYVFASDVLQPYPWQACIKQVTTPMASCVNDNIEGDMGATKDEWNIEYIMNIV